MILNPQAVRALSGILMGIVALKKQQGTGKVIAAVTVVVGVLVVLDKPIDFDSVDRQPVDLAFALFAPIDAGVEHLKALALVSRTLRNTSLCAKLRANSDPVTLYAIVTEAQVVQAA